MSASADRSGPSGPGPRSFHFASWGAGAPELPFCLVKRPLIMKSATCASCSRTLASFNLSHMDCLDGLPATYGSILIISCTTNNASPNEYINPEILMKNHHKGILGGHSLWEREGGAKHSPPGTSGDHLMMHWCLLNIT